MCQIGQTNQAPCSPGSPLLPTPNCGTSRWSGPARPFHPGMPGDLRDWNCPIDDLVGWKAPAKIAHSISKCFTPRCCSDFGMSEANGQGTQPRPPAPKFVPVAEAHGWMRPLHQSMLRYETSNIGSIGNIQAVHQNTQSLTSST